MTKEQIMEEIDKYNKNHNDTIEVIQHKEQYYVLAYTRWNAGGKIGYNYNDCDIQAKSHYYFVFGKEKDADRFINEKVWEDFLNVYYVKKVTKKELENLGYTVPHARFYRAFDSSGECIIVDENKVLTD